MAKLVDSYSEVNRDSSATLYSSYSGRAQSFTAIPGKTVQAKFYLKKEGSPSGDCYAQLYAHSGTYGTSSVPTGSPLATSSTENVTTISDAAYELITFTFIGVGQYRMRGGVYYVIAVRFVGGDSSNRLLVGRDTSSPTHDGNYSYYDSSWHADDAADLCFYVYNIPVAGGGFSGFSPWVFMKDMWEKHNKLWTPKGLVLPKDLGFQM